jgi:molybdate transport system substrate-binding protein
LKAQVFAAAANIAGAVLLTASIPTQSAELKVISAIGIHSTIEDLRAKFELLTGHKLTIVSENLKRVQDGETADVIIFPRQSIDHLVKDGKASAVSVTDIARSSMGVAVRKGAPKPEISSTDSFKRAMLAAKSINIPDPARGGVAAPHIIKIFERLGITDEMKNKLVYAKIPGAAGVAHEVAIGEAEIALSQLQELVPVAGIEIVGPLPSDLQLTTVFSAAIMRSATNIDVAKALISYLRTQEAVNVIRAKRLEPATP